MWYGDTQWVRAWRLGDQASGEKPTGERKIPSWAHGSVGTISKAVDRKAALPELGLTPQGLSWENGTRLFKGSSTERCNGQRRALGT